MKRTYKVRQSIAVLLLSVGLGAILWFHPELQQSLSIDVVQTNPEGEAAIVLDSLPVKGRAPKTDYSRAQFGDGWANVDGCDMRNVVLHRDLKGAAINDRCQVTSGILEDPYTGKSIDFKRGAESSDDVQIDHVVALSDAWQKGAQQLSPERRERLANDPLELIAVDGPVNQQKGDGDAATWLPPNKPFRCQYVARQIAIQKKYDLWVTQAERDAMKRVLSACPGQVLPSKDST